jgi:cell division protein FtsI/penicillin-binding protein 2
MESAPPQRYYIYIEDQEHGPFEVGELEQLVKDQITTLSTPARALDSLQKVSIGDILKNAKHFETEFKRKNLNVKIITSFFIFFIILIVMIFYGFYNRIKSVESYIKKHQDDQKAILSTENQNTKNIFNIEIESLAKQNKNLSEELIKTSALVNQLITDSDTIKKEYKNELLNFSKLVAEKIQKNENEIAKIANEQNQKNLDFLKKLSLLNEKIVSTEKTNTRVSNELESLKNELIKIKEAQTNFEKNQSTHAEWINHFNEESKSFKRK